MRREVPGVLCLSLFTLGLVSLVQLPIGVVNGNAPLLMGVVLNVILLVGLYRGRRWAFVAILAFAILGFFWVLAWNPAGVLGVLVVNGIVAVPVVLAKEYFWAPPARSTERQPNFCGRCGLSLRGVRQLNCPRCGAEVRSSTVT